MNQTSMLEMETMFNKIGGSLMSDDFATKLLAWFHYSKGCNEMVVMDILLNPAIKLAQKKLNIYGGKIPNSKLIKLWSKYCKELKENLIKTPWLSELTDRYGKKILKCFKNK